MEAKQQRSFTAAALRADPRWAELEANAKVNFSPVSLESPWMSMDPWEHIDPPQRKLATCGNLERRAGCDSILRTIVVTPNETLGACCEAVRDGAVDGKAGEADQD